MFSYLRYKNKLRKLRNGRRKSFEEVQIKLNEARKNKEPLDKIRQIDHGGYYDDQIYNEEIGILVTDYLRNKANLLFLPLPDYKDENYWCRCNIVDDRYILTRKGIKEVRASIRKERRESFELYALIIGSVTGLLGTIIGVLSVIK